MRMAYNSILLCAFRTDGKLKTKDKKCEARSAVRQEIESMIEAITQDSFPNLTCVHYLECTEHEHGYSVLHIDSIQRII